jgi:hypothetical protein
VSNGTGCDPSWSQLRCEMELRKQDYRTQPGQTGPLDDDPGILIGSWYDYTPTSALDIDGMIPDVAS